MKPVSDKSFYNFIPRSNLCLHYHVIKLTQSDKDDAMTKLTYYFNFFDNPFNSLATFGFLRRKHSIADKNLLPTIVGADILMVVQ